MMLRAFFGCSWVAVAAGCAANPNADAGFYHPDNPGMRDPALLGLQRQAVRKAQDEEDPGKPVDKGIETLDRLRRTIELLPGRR